MNIEELKALPVDPENEAVLRKLETSKPHRPGMYLRLYNGRSDPDQDMNDWGEDGPHFGPLKWFNMTYMSAIKLHGLKLGEETGPMLGYNNGVKDAMFVWEDMIYYDGMFYGDWSLDHYAGALDITESRGG